MQRLARAAALLACVLVGACGHQIGDHCTQNVDCDPLGTRFCDLSAPGGYCTIEGCDVASCPSEAVCVRFFEPLPGKACDPTQAQTGCSPSERCLCDCADPSDNTKCTAPMVLGGSDGGLTIRCPSQSLPDGAVTMTAHDVAHCAPESSERRWCQKKCSSNGDCQPGYECRATGTHGAVAVSGISDGGTLTSTAATFCVQASR